MSLSRNKRVSTKHLAYDVKLKGYSPAFKYLWRVYVQGCLRRNVEWNLTPEQFEELLKGDCYYCGRPPFNITKNKGTIPLKYNGIDRVDNNISYTKDNSVSCCKFCNSMKSNLSEADFVNHIFTIANHQMRDIVFPAKEPEKAKVVQLSLFKK